MREKIERLLRLAESSDSSHERDTAYAKATRLAAAVGLGLDDFSWQNPDEVANELDRAVLFEASRIVTWRCYLAGVACQITGCVGYWRRGLRCFEVYGRQQALVACSVLFHAAEHNANEQSIVVDGLRAKNAFRAGFADGLWHAHLNAPALPGLPTALVLRDAAREAAQEAAEYLSTLDPHMQIQNKRTNISDERAYRSGHAAGEKMQRPGERRVLGDGS